jgi:hypothetical protein
MGTLFRDSRETSFQGFSIEFIRSGAGKRRDLLDQIREDVMRIAFASRGWTDEAAYDRFRGVFKIEPLYETNVLALVRQEGRLVGLAGSVNDWRTPQGSLIHLCSIGLLPQAQARGIIPAMMGALWEVTFQDPQVREDCQRGRGFVTGITQSPYLVGYLHKLFDMYPRPDRTPDAEIKAVARAVVQRFDPHLPLDEDKLVLRNEAQFFYRRVPYGTNRVLNAFCDSQLRYGEGDVFAVVGRVIPERLAPFRAQLWSRYGELLSAIAGPESAGRLKERACT